MFQETIQIARALETKLSTIETGAVIAISVFLVDKMIGWVIKLNRMTKDRAEAKKSGTNGNGKIGAYKIRPDEHAPDVIIALAELKETHQIVKSNATCLGNLTHGIDRLTESSIRQERILERIAEKT